MLRISQLIDEFAIDADLSCLLGNSAAEKRIGRSRREHPLQLKLPHFAPIQSSEISKQRKAIRSQKRATLKDCVQQFLPDQYQLSFQFYICNLSIGAKDES